MTENHLSVTKPLKYLIKYVVTYKKEDFEKRPLTEIFNIQR